MRDQWVRCDLQYSFTTRPSLMLPHTITGRVRVSFSFTRSPQGQPLSALRSSVRPCSRSRGIDRYSYSSAINATSSTNARFPGKKVSLWPVTLVADSWKPRQRRLRMWKSSSQISSGCSARARRTSTVWPLHPLPQ